MRRMKLHSIGAEAYSVKAISVVPEIPRTLWLNKELHIKKINSGKNNKRLILEIQFY